MPPDEQSSGNGNGAAAMRKRGRRSRAVNIDDLIDLSQSTGRSPLVPSSLLQGRDTWSFPFLPSPLRCEEATCGPAEPDQRGLTALRRPSKLQKYGPADPSRSDQSVVQASMAQRGPGGDPLLTPQARPPLAQAAAHGATGALAPAPLMTPPQMYDDAERTPTQQPPSASRMAPLVEYNVEYRTPPRTYDAMGATSAGALGGQQSPQGHDEVGGEQEGPSSVTGILPTDDCPDDAIQAAAASRMISGAAPSRPGMGWAQVPAAVVTDLPVRATRLPSTDVARLLAGVDKGTMRAVDGDDKGHGAVGPPHSTAGQGGTAGLGQRQLDVADAPESPLCAGAVVGASVVADDDFGMFGQFLLPEHPADDHHAFLPPTEGQQRGHGHHRHRPSLASSGAGHGGGKRGLNPRDSIAWSDAFLDHDGGELLSDVRMSMDALGAEDLRLAHQQRRLRGEDANGTLAPSDSLMSALGSPSPTHPASSADRTIPPPAMTRPQVAPCSSSSLPVDSINNNNHAKRLTLSPSRLRGGAHRRVSLAPRLATQPEDDPLPGNSTSGPDLVDLDGAPSHNPLALGKLPDPTMPPRLCFTSDSSSGKLDPAPACDLGHTQPGAAPSQAVCGPSPQMHVVPGALPLQPTFGFMPLQANGAPSHAHEDKPPSQAHGCMPVPLAHGGTPSMAHVASTSSMLGASTHSASASSTHGTSASTTSHLNSHRVPLGVLAPRDANVPTPAAPEHGHPTKKLQMATHLPPSSLLPSSSSLPSSFLKPSSSVVPPSNTSSAFLPASSLAVSSVGSLAEGGPISSFHSLNGPCSLRGQKPADASMAEMPRPCVLSPVTGRSSAGKGKEAASPEGEYLQLGPNLKPLRIPNRDRKPRALLGGRMLAAGTTATATVGAEEPAVAAASAPMRDCHVLVGAKQKEGLASVGGDRHGGVGGNKSADRGSQDQLMAAITMIQHEGGDSDSQHKNVVLQHDVGYSGQHKSRDADEFVPGEAVDLSEAAVEATWRAHEQQAAVVATARNNVDDPYSDARLLELMANEEKAFAGGSSKILTSPEAKAKGERRRSKWSPVRKVQAGPFECTKFTHIA